MLPNHGYTSGFTDVTGQVKQKKRTVNKKAIDEDSQILEEALNYKTKGSRDSKDKRSS